MVFGAFGVKLGRLQDNVESLYVCNQNRGSSEYLEEQGGLQRQENESVHHPTIFR
jgi:hypothetical protein